MGLDLKEIPNEEDLLRRSWEFQLLIMRHKDPGIKDELGKVACKNLNALREKHRTRGFVLKTRGGFMIEDGMSIEEIVWPTIKIEDEMRLQGDLAKITYVRLNKNGLITWPLIGSRVIPVSDFNINELLPEDAGLEYSLDPDAPQRRPLYLPVALIEYALHAA